VWELKFVTLANHTGKWLAVWVVPNSVGLSNCRSAEISKLQMDPTILLALQRPSCLLVDLATKPFASEIFDSRTSLLLLNLTALLPPGGCVALENVVKLIKVSHLTFALRIALHFPTRMMR
jgi:hypothetical protein